MAFREGPRPVRVLGIDPGSRVLGYGVVEERHGRPVHVAHGVIQVDRRAPLEHRLKEIFGQLSQAVALLRPEAVAVEGVFTFRNARSALILGHARGVALLVAAQTGLSVHEYPPARVKRAVGASGGSDKQGVARMVNTLLSLTEPVRHDATDALAVALCHLNQLRFSASAPARRRRSSGFAALAERLAPSYRRFEAGG